jgi:arylsulfatase A-like enzyme
MRMLDLLGQRGLLDNTLVVVTSDNGMPFPRIKGQEYDGSNHLPLAIRWGQGVKHPGRTVDDLVSFIDFAPTFVEAAGLAWAETGMAPPAGRSLRDILAADVGGRANPLRDHVLIGKERHDVGRPHDWGYPIRGIVTAGHLYLRNFEPDRWPAGNPETGYLNCDGSPTKTAVLQARTAPPQKHFWDDCFGKRGSEEFYDLRRDPDCLHNLAAAESAQPLKERLQRQLFAELAAQGDPRMSGQGSIFEQFPYCRDEVRNFYERYMRGEKVRAGWVNPSDFEKPTP